MSTIRLALLVAVGTVAVIGVAAMVYVRSTGLVARSEPRPIESRVARTARSFAIPRIEAERFLRGDVQ